MRNRFLCVARARGFVDFVPVFDMADSTMPTDSAAALDSADVDGETIAVVDVEAQRRREECERKARRGEMDPRLEFVFQLLIDGTGLERHKILDHIFEGEMVLDGYNCTDLCIDDCFDCSTKFNILGFDGNIA